LPLGCPAKSAATFITTRKGKSMALNKLKLADDTKLKPARRIPFTKKALEAVKPPAKGEVVVHDSEQAGLVMRIRTTGAKAFYLFKKFKGRVVKLKLGDFPGTTVERARKAIVEKLADMNKGEDPAARRRQERAEATIGGIWAAYQRDHHPRCSPRTAAQDVWLFNRYLGGIASRRLGDFPQSSVKAVHSLAGKSSKTSANRSIQLLRRLYNYAGKHHEYQGLNPTRNVEMFRENSRERLLSDAELPRFLAAAEAEGQPWQDFFKLCLFTGARRSNLQAMKWKDIDMKAATWRISGDETKNGTDTTLPLAAPALEILERRKTEQAGAESDRIRTSAYVFPALRDKGDTLHLSQPARPFSRICKAAKIAGATVHDLRRTAGAWMAASGASLPMIGKALGHSDLRATAIYARLDLAPVRAAMEVATANMTGAKVVKDEKING